MLPAVRLGQLRFELRLALRLNELLAQAAVLGVLVESVAHALRARSGRSAAALAASAAAWTATTLAAVVDPVHEKPPPGESSRGTPLGAPLRTRLLCAAIENLL